MGFPPPLKKMDVALALVVLEFSMYIILAFNSQTSTWVLRIHMNNATEF